MTSVTRGARGTMWLGAASLLAAAVVGATLSAACGPDPSAPAPPPTLTGEALLDPNNCLPCHDAAFKEWAGSMHAYASDDPVFVAMNKRMQRETNGQAGSLCVSCHAPLAVRLGKTTDGLNLAELPPSLRGVTCYFCHSVDAVEGTHNNPLRLAQDGALRGGLASPVAAPHAALYSTLHDREQPASSALCGTCHDVVTSLGAHVERTFDEWQASLYAKPGQLACGKCHMEGRDGQAAAVPGAPVRRIHDHSMAAVDVALTPFSGMEEQRASVQRLLDATLLTKLCVKQSPAGVVAEVTLDNAFAGHKFPSGAAQDRRAWLELVAYRGGARVYATGVVPDGKAVTSMLGADRDLWLLRDTIYGADDRETHLFWQAARVESSLLPFAVTADPLDPAFVHSVTKVFTLPLPAPDRVTMRVRMRPVDFELLDDLVATKDLDPAVLGRVPTYELGGATREWTSDGGYRCIE
ncbi:MAG: cytochrome c family protein [Labilithrix sp.]|nr:cytochrome c family protein [Labilithrix sp.]